MELSYTWKDCKAFPATTAQSFTRPQIINVAGARPGHLEQQGINMKTVFGQSPGAAK